MSFDLISSAAEFIPTAVRLLLFILPAYIANAAPVLLGGHFPIDGGRRAWDGRPIFGPSKTWLGLAAGLAAGCLAAVLEAHILRSTSFDLWSGQAMWYVSSGVALSAGAMLGDLAGSFIKRRMQVKAGQQSLLLDQLPFLFFALAAAGLLGIVFVFEPLPLLFLVAVTLVLHRSANAFAHASGIKRVPW